MKLSELRKRVDAGRVNRDALHAQLDELIANKNITVAEREAKEAEIRKGVKAINGEIFPMEVVVGKARKIMKGKTDENGDPIDPLLPEEREIYDDCLSKIEGGLEF